MKKLITIYLILLSTVSYSQKQNDDVYIKPGVKPAQNPILKPDNQNYTKGIEDAKILFKPSKAASTAALISGIFWGPFGFIPTSIIASDPPENLIQNPSNIDNLKDKDYFEGYSNQAKKMKSKKVWKAYGTGAVISLCLLVIFVGTSP